jgi:Fe2+ or Zn2+ uptake regulation protein
VVHLGEFSAQMLSRYGFQLEQDHLTLYGSCQQCRQSGSVASGEEPDS